jgi:hypothetical protein
VVAERDGVRGVRPASTFLRNCNGIFQVMNLRVGQKAPATRGRPRARIGGVVVRRPVTTRNARRVSERPQYAR